MLSTIYSRGNMCIVPFLKIPNRPPNMVKTHVLQTLFPPDYLKPFNVGGKLPFTGPHRFPELHHSLGLHRGLGEILALDNAASLNTSRTTQLHQVRRIPPTFTNFVVYNTVSSSTPCSTQFHRFHRIQHNIVQRVVYYSASWSSSHFTRQYREWCPRRETASVAGGRVVGVAEGKRGRVTKRL